MGKNQIQTWKQGRFINQRQYSKWSVEEKERADKEERHLVRPAALENAICICIDPEDAKWIAERLNLAAKLEQSTFHASQVKSKSIFKWLRLRIKNKFEFYDIEDLQVGGHCGLCGKVISDEIFPKDWSWGVCYRHSKRGSFKSEFPSIQKVKRIF